MISNWKIISNCCLPAFLPEVLLNYASNMIRIRLNKCTKRKTPLLKSLLNKVAGLTPILRNICQRLHLHCTHFTQCYLSVLLYVQHLPHHHCYYSEAVVRRCSIKKCVLRNFGKFTGKHLYGGLEVP